MRFELTEEQRDFAAALEKLLAAADTVKVARAWAADDTTPGLALWRRLADQGVSALLVPEDEGGMGASPVELVIALEAIGRHVVPGPFVESAAYLATALAGSPRTGIAEGTVATVAVPPHVPYAVDADVAEQVYVAGSETLRSGNARERQQSIDLTRRLFAVEGLDTVGAPAATVDPFDAAVLAVSAQLLGLGERLLEGTVEYVRQRRQFGREIGSYQAVQHQLADVRIALDFARPLVYGAALSLGSPDGSRDVSAAKVAAGDAAYLASRVALQLHGAVAYTQELDLSLWILKVRALVSAWGTAAYHRQRVLGALVSTGSTSGDGEG